MEVVKKRKHLMASQFLPNRYLGSRNLPKKDLLALIDHFLSHKKKSPYDFLTFVEQTDFFEKLITALNKNLKHSPDSVIAQLAIEEAVLWCAFYLSKNTENINIIDPVVLSAMKHTDLGNLTFNQLPEIKKPLYFQIGHDVILIYPKENSITFFNIPDHACTKEFENIIPGKQLFESSPYQWVELDTKDKDATIEYKLQEFQKIITDLLIEQSKVGILKDFQDEMNITDERISEILGESYSMRINRSNEFLELSIKSLLFFLSSNDLELDWSSDTPQKDVANIKNIKNQSRKQVQEQALINQGNFKVTYVGRQYAKSEEARNLTSYINNIQSGRTVSPHFRRGHFRSQAHGKDRLLRRLIFIGPTFVNPNA